MAQETTQLTSQDQGVTGGLSTFDVNYRLSAEVGSCRESSDPPRKRSAARYTEETQQEALTGVATACPSCTAEAVRGAPSDSYNSSESDSLCRVYILRMCRTGRRKRSVQVVLAHEAQAVAVKAVRQSLENRQILGVERA